MVPTSDTHPSNPAQQNQYKQDDDNDPDQADAVMTLTIAIAAKPAAKAAKQKNDQDNEQDRSERHGLFLPSLCCGFGTFTPPATRLNAPRNEQLPVGPGSSPAVAGPCDP